MQWLIQKMFVLQQVQILGKHAGKHALNGLFTGALALHEGLQFKHNYPGDSFEFFKKNFKETTNEFDKDWKIASEGKLNKDKEPKKTDKPSEKHNTSKEDYAKLLLADEHGKT
ncbi:MAG: hypothetical protein ACK56I_20190, partial [bacterium]